MTAKSAGIAIVFLALCTGAVLPPEARAQEYRFQVPEVQVVLTVQPDAAVLIDYRIVFHNEEGAHPIDVVDVGMPTKHYEVIRASVDGRPAESWKPSTFIEIGPEVHLGRNAIAPGSAGTFECEARVTDMVFADRTNPKRASLQFSPTWFGDKYVVGETDLLLIVKFPPGVQPDSVVWHSGSKEFFKKGVLDPDNVAFVSWKDHYRLTGQRLFGCSFPRDVMKRVVTVGRLQMLLRQWEQSKTAQKYSAFAFLALFGIGFFLITRGTGITIFLIWLGVFVIVMVKSPALHLGMWLLIPVLGAVWYFAIHRRRPHYMPALARVEGGRICRGLTAPEAAVLLQMPVHRVLGIVVTGLLSKGVIRVAGSEPFALEAVGTRVAPNVVQLPDGRKVSLDPYEVGFFDALTKPPLDVAEKDLGEPLKKLVGLVRYKMEGFDEDATRAYYRNVASRAWDQVSSEDDKTRKDNLANHHLNWLSLVPDYDRRMERERERGWYYDPVWYYSPGYASRRDWVHDMSRWMTPTAQHAAPSVGITGKGLDLSGVDRFTLDTLRDLARAAAESGGRGSGCVGGGCACACAGCACACACAGGGR